MPDQILRVDNPSKRIKHFDEIVQGLKRGEAIENARLFAQRKGNVKGEPCPFGTDTFAFLEALAKPSFQEAMHVLRQANPLVNVTSRLCKDPFLQTRVYNKEGHLISIRLLERFVADHVQEKMSPPSDFASKIKIAVVGAGPAGLSAAFTLTNLGYAVTVYDSLPEPGGCLRWAYGKYRLPTQAVDRDVAFLKNLGIRFKMNCMFGTSFGLKDLFAHDYDAVFLATGASIPQKLGVAGEDAAGVISAEEFLLNLNLMRSAEKKSLTGTGVGQRVVVVGGGNAAFDCARSALRLGCEVKLVLNGTEEHMNVRDIILQHAREEGVGFELMTQPKEVVVNPHGLVEGLRCAPLDYADPEKTGVWDLHEVPEADFVIPADTVIVAVGHKPSPVLKQWDERLKLVKNGLIKIDHAGQTSIEKVYACGNAVTGPGPVFSAMIHARRMAEKMHEQIIKS